MRWPYRVSVAPMMQRTDRHFRYLMRLISKRTLLYTEMVTTGAILFGDRERHLAYNAEEHPVSLQLGGDDPIALTECARIGESYGYDEINLNIGCPSDRVQSGNFGACLMKQPELVAGCVAAMQSEVSVPVTVKHRIGVDEFDSYDHMLNFVDVVAQSGCTRFSVHARKAWLKGLSPKQNRTVPPLRYEDVYRLKSERPNLFIEINGGFDSESQTLAALEHVDAVMIGRAAYETPMLFANFDRSIYGDDHSVDVKTVVREMADYAERYVKSGGRLHHVTVHMHNLFKGVPGAKRWRRHLAENTHGTDAEASVILDALALVG